MLKQMKVFCFLFSNMRNIYFFNFYNSSLLIISSIDRKLEPKEIKTNKSSKQILLSMDLKLSFKDKAFIHRIVNKASIVSNGY